MGMILFYLVSMYLLCFLCFNSLINKKFSDFKVYYKICKILGFDSEIIEIRFQRSQKHLIGQWCIDMLLRKSSVIRQKGESQNGCSKETKHANFSEKNEHFLTCAYQEVRHVRFSENLACFVFLKYQLWDWPFCLITEEMRSSYWQNDH